jgi:uncharacterized protein
MKYKKLGNTDLNISSLGFGTMRLPVPNAGDFTKAITLIQYAIKKGINFFDIGTFYCHYQCEAIFGQATHNTKHHIIFSGKNTSHQSPREDWIFQLKNTLHLLDRDALDIYFIHYLDYEDWERYFVQGNGIDQINLAKKEGLIKCLGFSSHDAPESIRKLIDTKLFDAAILSYNFINRTYEDTIHYAWEKGLGVITMNPLAGGILKDSYLDLHELTSYFNDDVTTIALNYVLTNPYIHCALSGMQTMEEINKNLKTVGKHHYSSKEIELINDVIARERNEKMVYCTSCNYCLPCPQGIDIPKVIQIWNQYNIIKGKKHFNRDYQFLDVTADCCIKCGTCEEKCPNGIGISEFLEKVGDLFS